MTQFRPRAVFGPLIWLIASAFFALLLWVISRLISISLQPQHPAQAYLNSNLIIELGGGVLFFVIAMVWQFARKGALFAPIFFDRRTVLNRSMLQQQFEPDASCQPLKEWGWQLKGGGVHSHSEIRYKSPVSTLVTIGAEFRARTPSASNKYWRCGIRFADKNGADALCVHLDNHNLLVGYIGGQVVLKVTAPYDLENKFLLLRCQLAESPNNSVRAYCSLDDFTYLLGDVPLDAFPWSLSLRAWSDGQRNHLVDIRDISLTNLIV